MALRQIRQYGDEILQKKAKPVVTFDSTLHGLLEDMWDTLREHDGLGLAAPQVGLLRRVVIVEMEEATYEIVNPEVLETSGSEVRIEACLSVPNKQGDVERPAYIKIKALDRYGNPFIIESDEEMLVTALCHEIDHLDGILFLDKALKIQDRPLDEEITERRNKKDGRQASDKRKSNVRGRK